MARVHFTASTKEYTGGEEEIELEAKNVMQLFRKLGEQYPALSFKTPCWNPSRPMQRFILCPRLKEVEFWKERSSAC